MPPAIPLATYRLQLTSEFGFDRAAELVPYLQALGVSHLYLSPFLAARRGSTHGYDIVDHQRLNESFGGEEGFARLCEAAQAADLGLILDFVPNHMGVGHDDNALWLDVLEWGPKSAYADVFDIEWDLLPFRTGSTVLLPILGTSYGEALESGEIALRYDAAEGSFAAWYYDHKLPIRPSRYSEILRTVVAAAHEEGSEAGRALLAIADAYGNQGRPSRAEAPKMKAAIAAVAGGDTVIARGLAAYRPDPADPGKVLLLHRLLERQHYRLAHWRVSLSEINYRRFFDINDLAGIRVENPRVFAQTHKRVAQLVADGRLQGIRIDHIDGLYDPRDYCRRLQRLLRRVRGRDRPDTYVVVEKILAEGERMPALAGVAGTTGYEWLNAIARVLVNGDALPALQAIAEEVTGDAEDFEAILMHCKRRTLDTILASEFTLLARLLARIAAGHWRTRDYTLDRLRAALHSVLLHYPVYRTYVDEAGAGPEDRKIISGAVAAARRDWYGPDADIFNFIEDALTLDLVQQSGGYSRLRVQRFAAKVQQVTGPLMAKSLEDTAFYRYLRLLALNDVGGDPAAPALSVDAYHARMAGRADESPHGMTATATHDTKRGEDTRARLLAISELAEEWGGFVRAAMALNAPLIGGDRPVSRAHAYLMYQTFAGTWPRGGPDPDYVARMEAYAIKAAREGKSETSWINPDPVYEENLTTFVRAALDLGRSASFIELLNRLAPRLALLGAVNSLSQVALKLLGPGVPDIYQGCELWDLSLVDPDNRRPVDYRVRAEALQTIEEPDWPSLAAQWPDGRIKMALTHRLLRLRRQFPAIFTAGAYHPLAVAGGDRKHVIAFARGDGQESIVVAIGRHFAAVSDGGRIWPQFADWDARLVLGGAPMRDLLRQRDAPVTTLFDTLPVAVFHVRQDIATVAGHAANGRNAAIAIPLSRGDHNNGGRDMADREQRIRERAYQIWLEEGQPKGRDQAHWDMASELVAIEDNQDLATKPIHAPEQGDQGEPVEPLEAVENAGEFPTLTDQGEEKANPSRRRRR